MGVRPLALVGGTPGEIDRYSNWLEGQLATIAPLLVDNDTWSDALMTEVFGHPWLSMTYAELPLNAHIPVLTNEVKAYLAASVLDDRKANAQWFQRRVPVIEYLTKEGTPLLESFGAACLADIAHPGFLPTEGERETGPRCHNDDVLSQYGAWYGQRHGRRRQLQTRSWVRKGKLVSGEFHAPEIQLFGDIHRFAILNRAQMRALADRDIILLNDLYSEDDTRFRDRQRQSDRYLNLLCFEPWLRQLVRSFLLDKVAHGELAPGTAVGMLSRLRLFARFLREDGIVGPKQIGELTMERYLAWGNTRNAAGKNWYTDIVQLMCAAPVLLPGQWPATDRARQARGPAHPL